MELFAGACSANISDLTHAAPQIAIALINGLLPLRADQKSLRRFRFGLIKIRPNALLEAKCNSKEFSSLPPSQIGLNQLLG